MYVQEDEPRETIPLESVEIHADASKSAKRYQIDLVTSSGQQFHLAAENKDEQENWLQALAIAAVPDAWPGGYDFNKRPQPLLYSMWVVAHTGNASQVGPMSAAEAEAAGSKGTSVRDSKVPSPFKRLEPWKSAASWKRRGLILQKLRLCSVVFEGVDSSRFIEDREVKRNTLLEIVDYCDTHGRTAFQDARLLEDTFTMVRLNLFRTLPRSPPPTGDPDEEEETFTGTYRCCMCVCVVLLALAQAWSSRSRLSCIVAPSLSLMPLLIFSRPPSPPLADPQWAHLNIVYELLLRLVSMDTIDLALKKKGECTLLHRCCHALPLTLFYPTCSGGPSLCAAAVGLV